jgi:cytochrome c heme-lyase
MQPLSSKSFQRARIHNKMAKDWETPAEVCPVDPATRAAWLKSNSSKPPFPGTTSEASKANKGSSCDSGAIDQTPASPPAPKGFFSRLMEPWPSPPSNIPSAPTTPKGLSVDREVSTIPRASPVNNTEEAKPANSEKESGVSESGNWIYPSEKMFFEAMKRKGHHGEAADMKTIVPIHNAVNERAWKEIKEWERPYGSEERCVFGLKAELRQIC